MFKRYKGKHTYLVTSSISKEIAQFVKRDHVLFMLYTKPFDNPFTYTPVKLTLDEQAQLGITATRWTDPNELNKKVGYPPNYFALKRDEDILDWVNENFKDVEYQLKGRNEVRFTGEYIESKLQSEESDKKVPKESGGSK